MEAGPRDLASAGDLADLIDRRREIIIERWTKHARRILRAPLSRPVLLDGMPALLDTLVRSLRFGRLQPDAIPLSAEHGEERHEQGADLDQVVEEHTILGRVILDVAEAEGLAPRLAEFQVLSDMLSTGVAESVKRFVAAREEKLQAAASEHARLLASLHRAGDDVERHRAQLLAVFEAMSDGVVVVDLEGRVVLANQAAANLCGCSTIEQLYDMLPSVLAHFQLSLPSGPALPPDQSPFERVRRGESISGWELRGLRTDTGQEWYVSFSGQPVRDEQGRQEFSVFIVRDVTERYRAEQALRESEEQHRALVDLAAIGMVMVEPSTRRFTRVNDRFCETTDYSADELLQMTVLDVTHPQDRDADVESYARMLRGELPEYAVEKRYVRKDGRVIWVHEGVRALRDTSGRVFGTVSVIQDITERRRWEDALQASEAALREADRRKNEFLAVLSHELRNPLSPIRNALFLLERSQPLDEIGQRAAAVIDRQVTQLARLVDDLLDVTRVARGKVRLSRANLDLEEVVRSTVEDHRASMSARGLTLDLDVAAGTTRVYGDRARLAQVLGNLLDNAAKFTSRGGRVHVALSRDDTGYAVLEVSDTGHGIEREMLGRLFEPFEQADRSLDRSGGGLGLGLALVKGLVELHGGTVQAHSEGPERGASFTVKLPLVPERERLATRQERQRHLPRARRVLIIEDNVDAAYTLREVLKLSGHEVAVAHTAPEGLSTARRFRPDVVLCDIGLPGLDGYEVARRLRADKQLSGALLVAMTGYAQPEDRRRAEEAGFDRHMAKPPDLEALEELLADAPAPGAGG